MPAEANRMYYFPALHLGYRLKGAGIAVCLRFARTLEQLDRMGLILADRGHTWTPKERKLYERRARELKRK